MAALRSYKAPIALAADLVEGATITGSINGAAVRGVVYDDEVSYVELYARKGEAATYSSSDDTVVAIIYGDSGVYFLETRTTGTHTIKLAQQAATIKKTVPKEYIDPGITDAIETAQSTAETAQSTAETAQSTAETAQSTAETALNRRPYSAGTGIQISDDGVISLALENAEGGTY